MYFLLFSIVAIFTVMLFVPITVEASSITQTMNGGNIVTITHPDSLEVGEEFPITVSLENTGTEEIENIKLTLNFPVESFDNTTPNGRTVPSLLPSGLETLDFNFLVLSDTIPGTYYFELKYSQVIVRDGEFIRDGDLISIPIYFKTAKPEPKISVETTTNGVSSDLFEVPTRIVIEPTLPSEVFPNENFTMIVNITPSTNITNVSLQVIPPKELSFEGDLEKVIPLIEQYVLASKAFTLVLKEEVQEDKTIPFQVIVKYSVASQRMVYALLAEELAGPIHALELKTLTPSEDCADA